MRRTIPVLITLSAFAVCLTASAAAQAAGSCCNSPGLTPSGPQNQEPVFQDLAKSGKKCWIGAVDYFSCEFDKTPKMGTPALARTRVRCYIHLMMGVPGCEPEGWAM
jgi:hypothetical protein